MPRTRGFRANSGLWMIAAIGWGSAFGWASMACDVRAIPGAGSLLAFRITADAEHDASAIEKAKGKGIEEPPGGYLWAPLDRNGDFGRDGLIVREGTLKSGAKGDFVLLKLDTQNVTERDLARAERSKDDRRNPAIGFYLRRDGARRFGELTRAHLPEKGGIFKYRVAILVEGRVITCPSINSEVCEAGIIEMGSRARPDEVDRLVKLLNAAILKRQEPPPPAIAVEDQDDAISQALKVDLPALELADSVEIDPANGGERVILAIAESVSELRKVLTPKDVPPSGGLRVATLTFRQGDVVLRKVWVYDGGEWGFERPGTSWTTGASPELWMSVRKWLPKE